MRKVRLHARLLALLLLLLGLGRVGWQVWVEEIPLEQDAVEPVWVIDARIEFEPRKHHPVKLEMMVPPLQPGYSVLSESFVAGNFGVSIRDEGGNRVATWSTRRAQGRQVLYYRLVLSRRFASGSQAEAGPQYRQPPQLAEAEQVAADGLIEHIRRRSADVETFVAETLRVVNDDLDDSVRLLLAGDRSILRRAEVAELILAQAHIPVQQAHVARLGHGVQSEPDLWLRTFNGRRWSYFNPQSAGQGLPRDSIVWWVGDRPMVTGEGVRGLNTRISVNRSQMSAIQMATEVKQSEGASAWELSLYDLPLDSQDTFRVTMMIPLGVLLILLLRNLVGIETLGTFTPVLVGLVFRETQLLWGVVLFALMTALGLSLRAYLDQLRLQMLPRLAVVLTFVVVMISLFSVLGHRLGVEGSLTVGLFPMVILTMVIERLSIVWEERGGGHAMRVAIGTLFAAALAHLLMTVPALVYFFFTFPAALLVLIGMMLWMGHYRGYRLTELRRFRALAEMDDPR